MSNDNKMIAKLGRDCRRLCGEFVHGIGKLIAYVAAFGSIGVWVYQIYGWLRFGEWTPYPLINELPYSFISSLENGLAEWQGVAKIVAWFLSINLGVWLLPLWGVCYGVGAAMSDVGAEIRNKADAESKQAVRSSLGYDK